MSTLGSLLNAFNVLDINLDEIIARENINPGTDNDNPTEFGSDPKGQQIDEQPLNPEEEQEQTLEPLSYAETLPPEMCRSILKWLSFKELIQARMVCKKWRAICSEFLEFSPNVRLSNSTFRRLASMDFGFYRLIVSKLTNKSIMETPSLPKILKTVEWLHFENPDIPPDILKWLLTTCSNLRDIKVTFCVDFAPIKLRKKTKASNIFYRFLKNFQNSIPVCANLTFLRMITGKRWVNKEVMPTGWDFDCECLMNCKALEVFWVSNSAYEFSIDNCSKIPSLKFNFFDIFPTGEHGSLFPTLRDHFRFRTPEPPQTTDDGRYVQDFVGIHRYRLPSVEDIQTVAHHRSKWDIGFSNFLFTLVETTALEELHAQCSFRSLDESWY